MRVLVVSPHPDDEAVGCGGTLKMHTERADSVKVIYLTSGEQGGHGRGTEETARVREDEARKAAGILGVQAHEFWRLPDGGVRVTQVNVQRLQQTLEQWRPTRIYVTNDREMHPDHRAAARLVRRAAGASPGTRDGIDVLMFEVWTPLRQLDEVIDITPYLEAKMSAVRAHASQCAVLRFDDACLGLARFRGEMYSWPTGDYAEVFTRMRR